MTPAQRTLGECLPLIEDAKRSLDQIMLAAEENQIRFQTLGLIMEDLTHTLHGQQEHPDWEYETVTFPLGTKNPTGPEGGDWEGNTHRHQGWKTFENHEESYWKRFLPTRRLDAEASNPL